MLFLHVQQAVLKVWMDGHGRRPVTSGDNTALMAN